MTALGMASVEMGKPKLGIIAGGGDLPRRLLAACAEEGRDCFVLALEGAAEPEAVKHAPHAWVRPGAIGAALAALRGAGVGEVVLAGSVQRPSMAKLRPDLAGAKLLARLGTAFFAGDDALLKKLIAFLEEEGFRVIGADALLSHLLAPEGPLGTHVPDLQAKQDIALGIRIARTLGAFDIGQAVITEHGAALGVEGAEGTEALIARCAPLRRHASGGVLIKAKKPGQETRADLPAIGPATVEQMHRAGFAGIAVEAGAALILGREDVVTRADRLGIFVFGFPCAPDVRHGHNGAA